MNSKRADFLFASPSAVAGIARFLDFAGMYDVYNISATEVEADVKATYIDWACVGDAFRAVIEKTTKSNTLQLR